MRKTIGWDPWYTGRLSHRQSKIYIGWDPWHTGRLSHRQSKIYVNSETDSLLQLATIFFYMSKRKQKTMLVLSRQLLALEWKDVDVSIDTCKLCIGFCILWGVFPVIYWYNAFLFICGMKIDANIFWLQLPFKFHMSKVLTLKFNHVTVVLLYCYYLIELSCIHFS